MVKHIKEIYDRGLLSTAAYCGVLIKENMPMSMVNSRLASPCLLE